jgi:hypothetical protein
MRTDNESLLPLIEVVHSTDTYQDRLRSNNTKEFTVDTKLLKKEKEFVRDTTLDPK